MQKNEKSLGRKLEYEKHPPISEKWVSQNWVKSLELSKNPHVGTIASRRNKNKKFE